MSSLLTYLSRQIQWLAIVNATPDSFTGDGLYTGGKDVLALLERNAESWPKDSIIDVGGQSTRPGATFTSPREEWQRIEPVLHWLKRHRPWATISVDTFIPEVAQAALKLGVTIINDVSGRPETTAKMAQILTKTQNPELKLVVTHNTTMGIVKRSSDGEMFHQAPKGSADQSSYLQHARSCVNHLMKIAKQHGSQHSQLIADLGLGFGKTPQQCRWLLQSLHTFADIAQNIMVGTSGKSFIGSLTGFPLSQRHEANLAVMALLCHQTQHHPELSLWVRVHDAAAHDRFVRSWEALIPNPSCDPEKP